MPTASPWTDRAWQEFRAGNLTRSYRDVLITLRTFRGAGGSIYPSHATLAERAKCSVRTVQRALRQAERLGLVRWSERRVKAAWRWLRTSNVYRLEMPRTPVTPGMRPPWDRRCTTGQKVGEAERKNPEEAQESKKTALAGMMAAAAVLPDLLAARRRAVMAGLGRG